MALNTLNCNYLAQLGLKGLKKGSNNNSSNNKNKQSIIQYMQPVECLKQYKTTGVQYDCPIPMPSALLPRGTLGTFYHFGQYYIILLGDRGTCVSTTTLS